MFKLSICIVITILSINMASAIDITNDVLFITPDTNATYHIANNFSCNELIVYNDSLYIDNGEIITYPDSGWVNISLELLENTSTFCFSNNATIVNLTITNGFAGFEIKKSRYDLCYQFNNTVFSYINSDSEKIIFVNIPADSWYIIKDGMFKKVRQALEDIPEALTLAKDKLFNIIPFIISIILFAGFGLAIIVMTSKIKRW